MAHDAKFVENRLRLDVFLRAVEHGMPQRPSRFQRCDQFSNEQPQSYPSRLFSGAHTSTTIVPVAACQTVPLPCKYRASDVACSAAAAAANLNEANVSNERVAFGAYDLAREKVQLSPCLQRPSVKKPVSGSETTTPMPFRSRKILRRRLPVHTLPLVRVPTNGLPEPCHTRETVVHVTTVEPSTEETPDLHRATYAQTTRPSLKNVAVRCLLLPRQGQGVQSKNIKPITSTKQHPGSQTRLPIVRPGTLQMYEAASDGFVGSELHITSAHKATRHQGSLCKKSKKVTVVRGLSLRKGPLPDPPREMVESSATNRVLQPSDLFEATTPAGLPRRAGSQPWVLSPNRSVMQSGIQLKPLPRRMEKLISNKLSSVSAPVRRSESSESRQASGTYSAKDGAEYDEDDSMTFSESQSGASTRTNSPLDETHQFQHQH